jgi:hypothetical protein
MVGDARFRACRTYQCQHRYQCSIYIETRLHKDICGNSRGIYPWRGQEFRKRPIHTRVPGRMPGWFCRPFGTKPSDNEKRLRIFFATVFGHRYTDYLLQKTYTHFGSGSSLAAGQGLPKPLARVRIPATASAYGLHRTLWS